MEESGNLWKTHKAAAVRTPLSLAGQDAPVKMNELAAGANEEIPHFSQRTREMGHPSCTWSRQVVPAAQNQIKAKAAGRASPEPGERSARSTGKHRLLSARLQLL